MNFYFHQRICCFLSTTFTPFTYPFLLMKRKKMFRNIISGGIISPMTWRFHGPSYKKKKKRQLLLKPLHPHCKAFFTLYHAHTIKLGINGIGTQRLGQIDKSISLGLGVRLEAGMMAEMRVQLSWSRKQSFWHEMTVLCSSIQDFSVTHFKNSF